MKRTNVSIFVPHAGCPHQCSFCNQNNISGSFSQPTIDDVKKAIELAVNNRLLSIENSEIAFFGGSFTALDRDYMVTLLKTACQYTGNGEFKGIRISTRPDAIDDDIIYILKKYNVTSVELGAQSMDDNVLLLNKRGHTSEQVEAASNKIKGAGLSLGLQMMTGLYGDTYDGAVETAKKLARLKPDTMRIYPTVVLENTHLAELWRADKYKPMDFDETIKLCGLLLEIFEEYNIRVIRMGLHASESLESTILAGVYHPALREICESEMYYNRIISLIRVKSLPKGDITIYVNDKCISKAVGQKRNNIKRLGESGYNCIIKPDPLINAGEIKIMQ